MAHCAVCRAVRGALHGWVPTQAQGLTQRCKNPTRHFHTRRTRRTSQHGCPSRLEGTAPYCSTPQLLCRLRGGGRGGGRGRREEPPPSTLLSVLVLFYPKQQTGQGPATLSFQPVAPPDVTMCTHGADTISPPPRPRLHDILLPLLPLPTGLDVLRPAGCRRRRGVPGMVAWGPPVARG